MATVKVITPREQAAHFGLYRTSAGGDESIIVRRKIGEPTDYMHTTSKKLKRQREVFGMAAAQYGHLTGRQKHDLKGHVEEVEYIRAHGPTGIKVLQGRALFISKAIHSLITTDAYLYIPGELCIVLVDQDYNPIPGYLRLNYWLNDKLKHHWPVEISPSNWLFQDVPTYARDFYLHGYYPGYYDFSHWDRRFLTWHQLLLHHYHPLRRGYFAHADAFNWRKWAQMWLNTFFFPINKVRFYIEIATGTYSGQLEVGIRDYSGDRPPGTFIFQSYFHLSSPQSGPRIIDFTKYNLDLKPGDLYYMWSMRLIPYAEEYLRGRFFIEMNP